MSRHFLSLNDVNLYHRKQHMSSLSSEHIFYHPEVRSQILRLNNVQYDLYYTNDQRDIL
jgi:hypothetical protein